MEAVHLYFEDHEWPKTTIDETRHTARAVVVDDDGQFYFAHSDRQDVTIDEFAPAVYIECSGGGIEEGETAEVTVLRELQEELGIVAEIVAPLGIVEDYYNVIHRHNVNHFFLCRFLGNTQKHQTVEEEQMVHMTTLQCSKQEALAFFEAQKDSRLGRLITQRDLPMVMEALKHLEASAKSTSH